MRRQQRQLTIVLPLLLGALACPGVPRNAAPVPEAASLQSEAERIATQRPDSVGRALVLWQSAAALYSVSGHAESAALAFESIADTYASRGRPDLANEYYRLASTFYRAALANEHGGSARVASRSSIGAELNAMAMMVPSGQYVARYYVSQGKADSALAYFGDNAKLTNPPAIDAAVALLQVDPILGDTSVMPPREFVRRVSELVRIVSTDTSTLFSVASVGEATRALQAILAHQQATATVVSVPPGATVRYWAVIADSVNAPELTTNTRKLVRPAAYVFVARDQRGRRDRRIVACATNCEVTFVFPSR